MALRTRFEAEFEQISLKLKAWVKNPRTLSALIEERSPWLSRRVLGAASNFTEPFVVGMGLEVHQLSEDMIEVSLPDTWRNRGENGLFHSGALCTLGEFTSRLFWEYHLGLGKQDLSLTRLQLRVFGQKHNQMRGHVRAVYRTSVSEREKILYRLRSDGRAETDCEIAIYDLSDRLLAQVEVEWGFAKQLAIGASAD